MDGRTLIVQNALTVPTNGKLRVSTALIPYHTGTEEYPLIQFESLSDVNLNQYNWIADQRYYLKVGASNSYKIVLRSDTYAPMAYQRSTSDVTLNSDNSETRSISLYIQDYVRDAIDKKGISIRDASNNAYPSGLQVYLSTQDVQLKDGTYGYVYDSSKGDIQLDGSQNSYATTNWRTTGTYTNINGASITASTTSPVLSVSIKSRTYESFTNYFIYVRDVAGNWSKFLLDTQGPSMSSYGNVTSTRNDDGTFNYTFSNLKFEDVRQSASYGTSDISDLSYVSNASKFINTSRSISEVKYNTTGLDPWKNSGTNVSFDSSTGVCTLTNVKLTTDKLYIFAKDGYGNKSKYEFVPVTFDAQCGGEVPDGKLSNDDRYYSTLCQIQGRLTLSQIPSDPVLKNLGFRYWYKSTDTSKSDADIQRTPVTEAVVYYPLWSKPTVTISTQVAGNAADKNQTFNYTVDVFNASGVSYGRGQKYNVTSGVLEGTEATAPSYNGTITADSNGKVVLTLKHGQSVTLEMPDYYGRVNVAQRQVDPYTTTYAFTDGTGQPGNTDLTSIMKVTAINRSVAYTNTAIKSQPVIYQQKMEGEWTKDQGDNYGRRLTVYIRDLYGNGIDTKGSSFSTSEKAEFPGCTYAQVYLSTYDAPKADRGFKFRYKDAESEILESLCSCYLLNSGSFTDIEGKTVKATFEKPVWKFEMTGNYQFDQNKNYFIYVRDLTGKWTKYLLDTKGPRIENTGTITKSKENDNDTEFTISKIQVKDEMIDAANGTSDLTNESQENFTYVANATKYKGTEVSLVRNNKTGKFSDTYKTPTKIEGTYTAVESMNNGEMLYVYAQDYYGNTTAQQYVLVGFDASGNAQYKKASFENNKRLKRELVAKGQKLSPSQIPSNPGFHNDNTSQKFTQWSDSTDPNKKKVDLKTARMTKSVILNADYEKPGVIIKQMIKGDGIWNNQEFTYKVKTSYPKGKVIPCKGSYVSPAVNAPNITSLTVDANQEITFKLKAGQTLELIPGDNQYTIKSIIQDSNGTNCEIQKDAKVISSVENVAVDEISTNFVFTNTKNIVVTGVDGGNTDNSLLLVGLMGVLLIAGTSVLRLRGRRRS